MIDFNNLTLEQLKVVNCNEKYILCNACPGSGKTQTLAARAQRLWTDYQEPILICTFSNKAAKDLQERVGLTATGACKICTIHSLCYSVVKHHWKLLGELYGSVDTWPLEPKILSVDEELLLLAEQFPKTDANKLIERFLHLRSYSMHPGDVSFLQKKGVYFGVLNETDLNQWRAYEISRLARGSVTYDDMITLCQTLLSFPQVSTQLARKYSHVLIDEAQDTSTSQWSILRLLMSTANTTLVVFDQNQAIYGWRGSDVGFIQSLGLLQSSCKFSLTQNFRSGKQIGALANDIMPDKSSQIQTLDTHATVSLHAYSSRAEEVVGVLRVIGEQGAVLARTNSYLEPFERQCLELNIPYTGCGFYRSHHIQHLAAFVREYDGTKLLPVLKQAYMENASFSKWEKSDFKSAIKIIESEGVSAFLTLLDKSLSLESPKGLTLLTGHSSKGLEWDSVCVVGVQEGNIPHRLSADENEERNLLYVMVTRPRKNLHISCVGKFSPLLPPSVLSEYRKGSGV